MKLPSENSRVDGKKSSMTASGATPKWTITQTNNDFDVPKHLSIREVFDEGVTIRYSDSEDVFRGRGWRAVFEYLSEVKYGEGERYLHAMNHSYRGRVKHMFDDALPKLPHNARILDMGCSFGYTTWEIAELYPSAKVTGIDLIPAMRNDNSLIWKDLHEMDYQATSPPQFLIANGYHLPFKDGFFNAVFLHE